MKDSNTSINAALLVQHHVLRVLLEANPTALAKLRLERELLAGAMLYSDLDDELREAMHRYWGQLLDNPPPPPAAG